MATAKSASLDPGEIVRRFRENYTNYFKLWTRRDSVPAGVTLRRPDKHPIEEEDLPSPLRDQLRAYRRAHPKQPIRLLKHLRTVNGRPELVVEDETDLPGEDHLLILSQTVTVTAHDSVQIITDLFVARRG